MLVLLLLALMPMPVMLALTLMLPFDAFDVVAYAVADDTNADEEMPNIARHLAGACATLMMTPALPMLKLLRQLLRANACDDAMFECVCVCVRLCLST